MALYMTVVSERKIVIGVEAFNFYLFATALKIQYPLSIVTEASCVRTCMQ